MVGTVVKFVDLDSKIQSAVEESIGARERAYCPYSKFKVGATAITDKGGVYTGCNVENMSYGLTICAERTALVKAISLGETAFQTVIVCATAREDVVPPCGACRQFIAEFARNSDIDIYLTTPDKSKILKTSINEILPLTLSLF